MKRYLVPILVVLFLLTASCARTPESKTSASPKASTYPVVIDTSGGSVRIEKRPEKIVSLSPTATEMLFAIDAGKQVVAADSFSTYPPEAPKTDLSGLQPNLEAIAKYQPDLVIFSTDTGDLAKSLTSIGITSMHEDAAKNLEETYDQILDLGKATGNIEEAETLVKKMKADIKEIVSKSPKSEVPLTYYHELDTTYFSVTSKTFIGEVYSLLGLKNIADEADKDGSGYPQLSGEYIISADPDLIFLADSKCCQQSLETVGARPGWSEISAVKNKQVIQVDDDVASRWGPRIVDFLREVSKSVKTPATAEY